MILWSHLSQDLGNLHYYFPQTVLRLIKTNSEEKVYIDREIQVKIIFQNSPSD